MIKLGTIVKSKSRGLYGTVEYSSFGYSVHSYIYENGQEILGKTVGMREHELREYYEILDGVPDGYKQSEYGGLRKINKDK